MISEVQIHLGFSFWTVICKDKRKAGCFLRLGWKMGFREEKKPAENKVTYRKECYFIIGQGSGVNTGQMEL